MKIGYYLISSSPKTPTGLMLRQLNDCADWNNDCIGCPLDAKCLKVYDAQCERESKSKTPKTRKK